MRDDHEWQALCRLIGRPELAADARYATEAGRHAHHDAIDAAIGEWMAKHDKVQAMQLLQAAGVPAGAVLDGRDLHFDPQLSARGLLESVQFPPEREMGKQRKIVGRPWRFSSTDVKVRGPAPTYGQNNRYVLREILGYDEARCAALEQAQILVDKPLKVRDMADLSMDERVRLGRLAYWDKDYQQRLGAE